MSGLTNPIVFYPAAIIMILFALLAIKFKNIVYSLLSAIIVFFAAGMYFYLLGSEFNAVIQIAIYGIAVPVILGLAIMFTDFKKDVSKTNPKLKYFMLCVGIVFFYVIFLSMSLFEGIIGQSSQDINLISSLGNMAQSIYVKYVWAFELVSLILTITVVGLSVLKLKRRFK